MASQGGCTPSISEYSTGQNDINTNKRMIGGLDLIPILASAYRKDNVQGWEFDKFDIPFPLGE